MDQGVRASEVNNVLSLEEIKEYLDGNLGVANKLATTYVAASAASKGDSGLFALSGSVNLLHVENKANAWIGAAVGWLSLLAWFAVTVG